jgi:hypothetical protein
MTNSEGFIINRQQSDQSAGRKGRTIAYWVTTVLLAFIVGSGGTLFLNDSRDLEGAWSHSPHRAAISTA